MVKDRIKTLMEERGWKVNHLAFYADVSGASIYNIFNGADPSLRMVARLARALNVATCELIDDSQRDDYIDGQKNEDSPDSEDIVSQASSLNAGLSSFGRAPAPHMA